MSFQLPTFSSCFWFVNTHFHLQKECSLCELSYFLGHIQASHSVLLTSFRACTHDSHKVSQYMHQPFHNRCTLIFPLHLIALSSLYKSKQSFLLFWNNPTGMLLLKSLLPISTNKTISFQAWGTCFWNSVKVPEIAVSLNILFMIVIASSSVSVWWIFPIWIHISNKVNSNLYNSA